MEQSTIMIKFLKAGDKEKIFKQEGKRHATFIGAEIRLSSWCLIKMMDIREWRWILKENNGQISFYTHIKNLQSLQYIKIL